jgi:hypothetical protein
MLGLLSTLPTARHVTVSLVRNRRPVTLDLPVE